MMNHASEEALDIREKGAPIDGVVQISETRLYMQLHVFTGCLDINPVVQALEASGLESVLYENLNDPTGIGVLAMSEEPADFAGKWRSLFNSDVFIDLCRRDDLTMIGRTYSSGREPDLNDWLLVKPRRNVFNPTFDWAIWYPLRRKPDFELLDRQEQGKVLMEHGMMGRRYGDAGHAMDVRLACHGLDQNDNDFLIGIVGPELYPLSRLVQDMRKSQQTSKYLQSLGPFFVARVSHRFRNKED